LSAWLLILRMRTSQVLLVLNAQDRFEFWNFKLK